MRSAERQTIGSHPLGASRLQVHRTLPYCRRGLRRRSQFSCFRSFRVNSPLSFVLIFVELQFLLLFISFLTIYFAIYILSRHLAISGGSTLGYIGLPVKGHTRHAEMTHTGGPA